MDISYWIGFIAGIITVLIANLIFYLAKEFLEVIGSAYQGRRGLPEPKIESSDPSEAATLAAGKPTAEKSGPFIISF
jgi:hypothetical protein